jgi:hypothetical protein
MPFQQNLGFTAMPQGILMDGVPLHKCDLSRFPRRVLSHLRHALELSKTMTPEDWGPVKPHGFDDIPVRALFETDLALAGAELNKSGFNPDELRDALGRWVAGVVDGIVPSASAAELPADTDKKPRKRFLSVAEAHSIARQAQSFADKKVPYILRFKADESGADCSGSTYYIYNQAGYPYSPRASVAGFVAKAKEGKIPFDKIPEGSSPQIGDVIVFKGNGHMAIYAGKDKSGDDLMWTASSKAKAYIQQKVKVFRDADGVRVPVEAYYRYQVADN